MKQLLIVKSTTSLNGGCSTPNDLSPIAEGAIAFYELGENKFLDKAPSKNFGIALGRSNNSPAFVIPEVDFNTLTVNLAEPSKGGAFSANVTIPTVTEGSIYTLVLIKNGTVPHERNTWTATETAVKGDTATTIATKLANYFKNMAATGSLNVEATNSGAQVTVTGKTVGEAWTLKGADAISSIAINTTVAQPAIGDAAYIKNLASMCAAGKGFTDTDIAGRDVYPDYPEAVEDLDYAVFTLRFAVGRDSAKTRDERVSQLVHIAVPTTSAAYSSIKTILPTGDVSNETFKPAD